MINECNVSIGCGKLTFENGLLIVEVQSDLLVLHKP